MSATEPLRHLRASTANKRPTPAAMADGQLALNTNNTSPGLFFKDSNGALVKVGPVHVGSTAPNASPAAGGSTGNAIGEQWLDTAGGTYVFKVWDGSAWRSETGTFVDVNGDVMTGALGIIAGSAGSPGLYFSGDTNTGIYSPGADQVAISTGGSGRLFVDASGNVLVGNATSGSALVELQADGDIFFRRLLSRVSSGECNVYFNSGDNSQSKIWLGGNTNFGHGQIIYDDASDYLSFVANNQERVRITSAGLVGVGTSAPEELVHIASTSAGALVDVLKVDNQSGATNTEVGIVFECGVDRTARISSANTGSDLGALKFWTAGSVDTLTERLRIDSSGRVGVGTTSPARTLHVAGSAVFADTVDTTVWAQFSTGVGGIGTNNNYPFAFATNGTERARIDSSGRLGIGTSSPSNDLDVLKTASGSTTTARIGATATTGANNATLILNNGGTGNATLRFDYEGSTNRASIGVLASDQKLTFGTAGSTAMTIDASQRVGIGTTPSTLLHIQSTDPALRFKRSDAGTDAYGELTTDTSGLVTMKCDPANAAAGSGFRITVDNSEALRVDSSSRLLVGTSSNSGGALLQVNGDRIRVATAKTPASATDTGTAGEICWDANYIYVCTATNTWKRTAIATW